MKKLRYSVLTLCVLTAASGSAHCDMITTADYSTLHGLSQTWNWFPSQRLRCTGVQIRSSQAGFAIEKKIQK